MLLRQVATPFWPSRLRRAHIAGLRLGRGALFSSLAGLFVWLVLLLLATPGLAAPIPGYLEFIGATARPASAEVTIALSKPAPYIVKTLPADAANPYRVYIDFDETKLGPGAFRERPLTSENA